MYSSTFRDITPYTPLKVNRRFGGKYQINLQGRRIRQGRKQHEAAWKQSSACFSASIFKVQE
jgi:hypothetical protein